MPRVFGALLIGGEKMVAKVVLNSVSHATDSIYDYLIPDDISICVGMRVVVPFGKGNKTYEGYVVDVAENSEFESLKSIISLADDFIYFNKNDVEIADFMRHRYFCKYSEAIKLLLPPNVNIKFKNFYFLNPSHSEAAKIQVRHSLVYEKIVSLLSEYNRLSFDEISEKIKGKNIKSALLNLIEMGVISETTVSSQSIKDNEITVVYPKTEKEELYALADKIRKRAPKQAEILETVCDYNSIRLSELLEVCNTTHSTVKALEKKEYIFFDKEIVRAELFDYSKIENVKKFDLTYEQQKIVDEIGEDILKNDTSSYLLHGVTGSGKTEVYLHLIEKCIKSGKNAVFLVPEISLTPQMIRQVITRFGESAAVLHSSLTIRERYDQWKKIRCGEVNVVVGARSAIFAPFDRIGLIIVDEEHESSYKSDLSPKYNTIEIARFRAKQHNSTLLLASATPSVETYYLASTGKIKLLKLKNRINNVSMPYIEVVDMREELKQGNTGTLSEPLKNAIEDNINNRFKTILFLNRRGYSGFIQCRSCGYVIQCPNCNISMTYHKSSRNFVCHYCDYQSEIIEKCPQCGSNHIKFSGDGTQKVEDELSILFPHAKILRMDADTTSSRNSHDRILKEFEQENSDILIGTQMITKGLDFEKVTLVGVLSADMSLHTDDFRSDEKTFDLITQVCGRAGRGKYGGRAIIQAYDPNNETIQFSKSLDYERFFKREIDVRKLLVYPPFCEIINFVFSSENELISFESAKKFHFMLRDALAAEECLEYVVAYRIVPAPLYKISGKYRYRFIMKLNYNRKVYNIIHRVSAQYRKSVEAANLIIDINPYNLS